jgi:imidazole glycerol phosphate synthase subunit HisF
MEDVLIVDSGGANLASLQFALERLGASTRISNDAQTVASAHRVILPGVGSGGAGSVEHFRQVFVGGGVDAALAASVFHSGLIAVGELKCALSQAGIRVRL